MAAFFPLHAAASSPLFSLLADLSTPQQQTQHPLHHNRHRRSPCRAPIRTFQPRFDVRETAQAFELVGELPGVPQDALSIEFADSNTLVIRGRRDRAGPATPAGDGKGKGKAEDIAAPEAGKVDDDADTASVRPRQPTVEDEYVDAGAEQEEEQESNAESRTVGAASARASAEVAAAAATVPPQQTTATATTTPPTATECGKYLLAERPTGSFQRVFNFPGRVEQGAVTALLRDGVLTVSVPKKEEEKRRIVVQ